MRPPIPAALARAAALVVFAAAPAAAQEYLLAGTVSLSAGAADYDLTGTGTTPTVALRGDAELRQWLVGEAGVSALRPRERFASRLTYVVPEAILQLQWPRGTLRPYLGVGGGWFYAIGPDRDRQSALAATAAAGVRYDFTDARFGLRVDARARGIDREFSRRTTELTGGLAWRF